MEDLTGRQFGPYEIVAPLGEGGMAAVYKAYQPSMERFVALKVLPRHMSASEEFSRRFQREARLLAQLQHPHILPVFDYGEAQEYPYIVMPFIESGTLAEVLRARRLSYAEVRRIMTQVGDALQYAHSRGMVHRDIKPSNILIDGSGNCLLTDFGLARMAEAAEQLTSSGAIMGTPAYMSPEQGSGAKLDHRSDIYSLGVILYELITGRVPYTAETPIAVVFKHIQDPLPSPQAIRPDLPDELDRVLLKSLAKDPADRYQSAGELVGAIQQAIPQTHSGDETLLPASTPGPAAPERLDKVSVGEGSIFEFQALPAAPAAPVHGQPAPRSQGLIRGVVGLAAVVGLVLAGLAILRNRGADPIGTGTLPVNTTAATTASAQPLPPPTTPSVAVPDPAGNSFRDDFDYELAGGWSWLAENPEKWTLSEVPGWLRLIATDASIGGPALPANILLREAPSGDYAVTTSLQFVPHSNFQFAGIVVFQDAGNVLQFGRAHCDLAESCVGDGIYFDNFVDGAIGGNSSRIAVDGPIVNLKLQKVGDTYTAFYSTNGGTWTLLGEHTRDIPGARIGLMAAQAPEEIPALFDYFTLERLPE